MVLTIVLGYFSVETFQVKNQFSHPSKVGELFVGPCNDVKCLPCMGSSMNPRVYMASLNRYISVASPPSLLLSSGLLIRLKSLAMRHLVSSGIWMFLNHSPTRPALASSSPSSPLRGNH